MRARETRGLGLKTANYTYQARHKLLPIAIGLVIGCGADSQSAHNEKTTPLIQTLKLEEAAVYRVEQNETLSQIALKCGVSGGATVLAKWNNLTDVDHVETGSALLVPLDTDCGRNLSPARLPRYNEKRDTCKLTWTSVRTKDANSEHQKQCAHAGKGFKICWRPWEEPGLEIRHEDKLVHRDNYPYGDGGSSGGVPEFAWKDIDGNGTEELILTQLTGWSNGLAIARSKVIVIDPATLVASELSTAFYHRDHWVQNDKSGCDFLWVELRTLIGPVLGEGNYFVGVRHKWNERAFEPTGKTFAAKRLLERFFDKHRDSLGSSNSAHHWLFDTEAEARPLSELTIPQ